MKKLFLSAALALALAGCAGIDSRIRSHDLNLSLPKDASFDALVYQREFVDSNGVTNRVSLVITNGSFKNNPLVIDAKTRRDVQMLNAGADIAAKVIGAAIP